MKCFIRNISCTFFLKKLLVFIIFLPLTGLINAQTCPVLSHNPYTDFNSSNPSGVATTLWMNLHIKLTGTLKTDGDFIIFHDGSITLNGITASWTTAPIPDGKIVADNTVSAPVTSFDMGTNTWITQVPLNYSSSDIFLSAGAITSSTGYTVGAGKKSTLTGQMYSNKSPFSSSWFYGTACYQSTFTYSDIAAAGAVTSIGGGVKAGTPTTMESRLVPGGSGGGGSNYTGSYSSTDNFTACQSSVSSPTTIVPSAGPLCPTITNPSAAQTICADSSGTNITVNTSYNTASGIKFVKFTSKQMAGTTPTPSEATAIYAGLGISTVTPTGGSSPYTATYTFATADFPNATSSPITYYVYAILDPDQGASCEPAQEIQVTVNPLPDFTLTVSPACPGNSEDITISSLMNVTTSDLISVDGGTYGTYPTGGIISGLSVGSHTIALKNSNGCITQKSVTINPIVPNTCIPIVITKN